MTLKTKYQKLYLVKIQKKHINILQFFMNIALHKEKLYFMFKKFVLFQKYILK